MNMLKRIYRGLLYIPLAVAVVLLCALLLALHGPTKALRKIEAMVRGLEVAA